MNRRTSFFRRAPSTTSSGKAKETAPTANSSSEGKAKDSSAPSPPSTSPAATANIFSLLTDQVKKGIHAVDTSSFAAVVDAIRNTESIDDRALALEHALTFISRLPEGKFATGLDNKAVQLLYNDLSHPNSTSVGDKYAWRTADGSHNNVNLPQMGAAGTPYARSVQQSHPLPKHALPDPGLIFDTLLRRDGFVEHPAGLSSLMFGFAALVIHSVFRTSHTDVNINETSSYVDLSPLYGHNQEAQDKVRNKDGRGMLYPDVFAEDRLLLLPPAVCAILVLFSRNHNYIVERIYEINERGTYQDPSTLSGDKLLAQDEELFQTGRLVNCGWFGSVVFSDYFSSILGLLRDGSSWSLNPFGEMRSPDHSIFERGQGNVCSVEFNCLYRWHATTSKADEEWVAEVFREVFDGKDPEKVTPADFKAAAYKVQKMQPDIQHWTFGRLERQANGTFKDSDLAGILHNATENPAAAFRARGTPPSMRLHEMMGIEQNRRWGVCSLNDFRRYLGLKPYATFLEWNPDPIIADAAEKLYGNIESLELYVGLQAEEVKPVVDGAGLCPGYTISRAILSDAIALTRGDRHFTQDYTPYNLTAWGFADCQRDPDAFGFGSTLGRLFLRTLPNSFTENSVYTFFPLMTPGAMKTNLTKLHLVQDYDLTRPQDIAPPVSIQNYNQIAEIMQNGKLVAPYAERAAKVVKGKGFFIAEGDAEQKEIYTKLFNYPETENKIGAFFREKAGSLIAEHSFTLVGGKTAVVDVVRDVLKVLPVYWAADISGLTLKTKETPHGDYSPADLYDMLSDIYSYIFLDGEKAKSMNLRTQVQGHIDGLLSHIKSHLGLSSRLSVVESLFTKKKNEPEQHEIVKRLREMGHGSEAATIILALMVGSTAELSLGLVNMINTFLDTDADAKVRSAVASKSDLDGFVHESQRLDPPFQGVYRTATDDVTVGGTKFNKGTRIFLDVGDASLDTSVFPEPTVIDPSRHPEAGYIHPDGAFKYLGEKLTLRIMSEVLRSVYSLKNVARAPGQSGKLKRFKDGSRPDLRYGYLDEAMFVCPWPTSMAIQYDV